MRGGGSSRQPFARWAPECAQGCQSVGEKAEKSKKWCILVHRRSLGTSLRVARLWFASDRAPFFPHIVGRAFPRGDASKKSKK